MKEVIEQASKGWKQIVGFLTIITLLFSAYQVYDHFTTPNISGEWYLTLKVEKSSYNAYIGDVIGIKAYFTQTDKSITGNGEKWEYRGQLLNYKDHSKLEFIGDFKGRHLRSNYVLYGKLRETTGIIEVEVTDGGRKMKGVFTGTAADTRGTITGERRKN